MVRTRQNEGFQMLQFFLSLATIEFNLFDKAYVEEYSFSMFNLYRVFSILKESWRPMAHHVRTMKELWQWIFFQQLLGRAPVYGCVIFSVKLLDVLQTSKNICCCFACGNQFKTLKYLYCNVADHCNFYESF